MQIKPLAVAAVAIAAILGIGFITQIDWNTQIKNKPFITLTPSGDTSGVTDLGNIQTAINSLPPSGGTVYLRPIAPWYISGSTGIQIGNGSATAASTQTGVSLLCVGTGPACVINSSIAGPAIQLNGPMHGWAISGLQINLTSTSPNAIGIEYVSSSWGLGTNISFSVLNPSQIALLGTTNAATSGPGADNSMHNIWSQLYIYLGPLATSATGVKLTSYDPTYVLQTSTACLEQFINLTVNPSLVSQTGVWLQETDTDQFFYYHMYGYLAAQMILFDYTGLASWPSDVYFFGLEGGGAAAVVNAGNPSGASTNIIYGFGQGNGMQTPVYVPNLIIFGYNMIFNNDLAIVGTASPGLRFITGIFRPGGSTTPPGDTSFWPEGAYIQYFGNAITNLFSAYGGEMQLVSDSTNGLTPLLFSNNYQPTSHSSIMTNLMNLWSDGTTQIGPNVLKSNDTLTVGNNNRTSNVTMTVAEGGGQTSTTVPPFRVVALGIPFSLNTTSATTSGATLQFSGGTTGVANGEYVNGVGILPGSVVSSFNGTSVTLNNNVVSGGVASGTSVTFEQIPINVFSISPIGASTVGSAISSNLGPPTAGAHVFCSNCMVSSPCTAGGSGTQAFANGSAWTCPF